MMKARKSNQIQNKPASDFSSKVKSIVTRIPKGSVMTYQRVAEKAGNPNAARAVANTMAANFDPTVPCHRVIRSDGQLGGYNRGGIRAKAQLLQAEGVVLLRNHGTRLRTQTFDRQTKKTSRGTISDQSANTQKSTG